jgi:tetratricopeptide (TPR) repeat protein
LTGNSLTGGASGSQSEYGVLPVTDNEEAYVLYLRAENYQTQGGFCTETSKAAPLLERAVELDPQFGEAWARLARAYGGGCPQIRNRANLAEDAMSRALALAPESPMVLGTASMRMQGVGELQQARELAEKALAINPNDPDALYALVLIYLEEDNWVAGYAVVDRLMQLDPLNFRTLNYYKYGLVTMRRWKELQELAERALVLYPDNELHYSWMAKASLYLGDRLTAIEMQRRAIPFGSPIDLWTGLDYQWDTPVRRPVRLASPRAYLGQFDTARQLIGVEYTREADNSSPGNAVGYLVNMGEIEALAGNIDASIEFFEQAIEQLPGKEHELFYESKATPFTPWISHARQSDPSLALLYAYRRVGLVERADIIANIFQQSLDYERQLQSSVGVAVDDQPSYAKVQFHAIEGRTQQALAELRFWRENDKAIFTYVKTDPFLENLHGEPEFQAIVAEIEAELAEVRAQYHANRVELVMAGNDG